MAFLRKLHTGEKYFLQPHHNFGRRGKTVDTCIDHPEISNIHTIIQWDQLHSQWQIRDVSRNGTWVDDKRLDKAENYALEVDQLIRFASTDSEAWQVEDLSPPCNLLIPVSPAAELISLSQYQLLPNDETPELAVFLSPDSGHWRLEYFEENAVRNSSIPNKLRHGDSIFCPGYEWKLFLIEADVPTRSLTTAAAQLNQFEFIFDLSQDEENTQIKLHHCDQTIDLEEHTYHYMLLHLARLRARDANRGLNPKSQGWIYNNQLAKDLGLETAHLNIQIFRARKLLAEKLQDIKGLDDLIQRRKGSMRFGCNKFKIYKGDHLECELSDALCPTT